MAKTSLSGPKNLYTLVAVLRCILCFQRITFLRTYWNVLVQLYRHTYDFLGNENSAGDWDCLAVVERLPAFHCSVDFIFLSFGIMGLIVEL